MISIIRVCSTNSGFGAVGLARDTLTRWHMRLNLLFAGFKDSLNVAS
jgi:hypothetical protein